MIAFSPNSSSNVANNTSLSISSSLGSSLGTGGGTGGIAGGSNFVMPVNIPTKDEWIKDEEVNECMVCATVRFGLINRRHHCRRCGRVVCSSCSQKTTLIENVARRTCDDCFRQLEIAKLNEHMRMLDTLNESLDEIGGSSSSGGLFRRASKMIRSPTKAKKIIEG